MEQQEKEFRAWGLGSLMVRNIVVGVIILLSLQLAAISAYFRAELADSRRRLEAVEAENRRCVKEAMERFAAMEREYLAQLRTAAARQDEIEKQLKQKRKR